MSLPEPDMSMMQAEVEKFMFDSATISRHATPTTANPHGHKSVGALAPVGTYPCTVVPLQRRMLGNNNGQLADDHEVFTKTETVVMLPLSTPVKIDDLITVTVKRTGATALTNARVLRLLIRPLDLFAFVREIS